MPVASLHLLRMADLQHLAIPGQNKVPRKGVRFSRFERSSPAMLWEWEARPPENWLLRTGRVEVDGQEMLLCVVDADCQPAVAMCEELLPPTPWTVDTQHGRHYYYLTTEISSQRIMGGLDQQVRSQRLRGRPGQSWLRPVRRMGPRLATDAHDAPVDGAGADLAGPTPGAGRAPWWARRHRPGQEAPPAPQPGRQQQLAPQVQCRRCDPA